MPKLKTHSGAKKRFKMTKNGKVIHQHAFKGHKLGSKTAKRKRGLRKMAIVDATSMEKMKKLLPYS